MSVLPRGGEIDVRAVSARRDGEESSLGNEQFGVRPPGGTDNRFREESDVVSCGLSCHFLTGGVNPSKPPAQGHSEFRRQLERTTSANLRDGHQVRPILKIFGNEIRIISCFDFLQSLVDFYTVFLLVIPILGHSQSPKVSWRFHKECVRTEYG